MPNIYSPNEYNSNFIRAIHRFYEEPEILLKTKNKELKIADHISL